MRQCVILVGGKGSRLGDITKDTPKPMIEISGKPFLLNLIEMAERFGFNDIILLASHANEVIIEYFKDYKSKDCNFRVIVEEEPLGTGGALINAYEFLENSFFCLNGDSIIDGNWLSMNKYLNEESEAVVALTETDYPRRYGSITINKNKIIKFEEKTENNDTKLINGGIYLLKKTILKNFPKKNFSLEKDILPDLAIKGKLNGVKVDGYFIDIGTRESLEEARQRNWNQERKAVIFDRDGTLNEDNGYTHKREDLKWKPGAINLIKYLNDKNFYVFIATNQAGIAKGKFKEKDMYNFHREMQEQLWSHGAHIDKFYFCPFHTEALLEEYKKDSINRKPATGMLNEIQKEWGLLKKNMLMIGDRDTDIYCAENFEINSILYNGKDNIFEFSKEKIFG
tara:strand:+ start:180 stop:1370 length:1191 start_codon:yes stop_codon:yes gene_type:complete